LIGFAVFFYGELAVNLREEDKQFLAEKILSIQKILQKHGDNETFLEEEIQRGAEDTNPPPYYLYSLRILGTDDIVLTETTDMAEAVPVEAFPTPVAETQKSDLVKKCVKWNAADGHSYFLLAIQSKEKAGQFRVIQVALDITREDALLANYKYKLAIILPLGLLLSTVFSALIARRSLKPLHDITLAAHHITASHLHARVKPDRWPHELMALAEAFDQMLGRLEDSFARLTQFSADLAHELRTPINNLMVEAEVTLTRRRSEVEYRDVLESVLEEAGKLSHMIDSLLFLARADNVQIPLQLNRIDVRQELEAICDSYEAVTEEQNMTIECEGESNLEVDLMLFQRAITNVLSNAIRYTPVGGRIKLIVETFPRTHFVTIRIIDNGCGIAPEHLRKVFDRFYRIDHARSSDPHNAGLGLSIVRSILAMHGGTVNIESQFNKGTTVILHFPLKR